MKKYTKKKPPHKLKKTNKTKKKPILLISIAVLSVTIGIIVGLYFSTKLDIHKSDIILNHSKVQAYKEDKFLTFQEKTEALEIEYYKTPQIKTETIKIEKPVEKTAVFHFEEPNLEKIDQPSTQTDNQTQKNISQPIIKQEPKIKYETVLTKIKNNKPKLIIIIDDVTTSKQIKKIKDIGYSVNMAFLPPTKGHPSSAKITKELNHYMIHLPLQASSSRYEESNTLYIGDDLDSIDKRLKRLKELYPNAKYINNHTGSKFTSNKNAMDNLMQVVKKYNFHFIDSRTTSKTVVVDAANRYGVKVYSRNIFLDNKKNQQYITKQLKKAIKIAKQKGVAIAIGHPYSITFQTLQHSKDLLEDLDLIYVDQL